jgi:hypothetical protein
MSEPYVTEFEDEDVVDDDLNDEEPVVESAEEYGYVEPEPTPPPDDWADQNPGFTEGTHA